MGSRGDLYADAEEQVGLLALPVEILISITTFLPMKDLAAFGATCKVSHSLLPAVEEYSLPRFESSERDDRHHVLSCLELNEGRPVEFEARAQVKDQGWGNRKSRLLLYLVRDGERVAYIDLFGVFTHNWKDEHVNLGRDNDITKAWKQGDTLQLRYCVGGGGGHQIFVREFYLSVMRESVSRLGPKLQRAELQRAELG